MKTNQEILQKAIRKAVDGGWELPQNAYEYIVLKDLRIDLSIVNEDTVGSWKMAYQEIIFNHEFCKALWGKQELWVTVMTMMDSDKKILQASPLDKKVDMDIHDPQRTINIEVWRWHIWQMVWSDDPIKYLGENTG